MREGRGEGENDEAEERTIEKRREGGSRREWQR
jgi:hypothetical protein